MSGVNKVILVGRLGQDPECKYMPSGGAVTNASLATSEKWKDKNTGQPQEATEWHRIVFFNKLGEIAGEYLKKGSMIYVEGKLKTRKWQAQDGTDRYTTEIVVSEMQMLDGKSDAGVPQAMAGQYAPSGDRSTGAGVAGLVHEPDQSRRPAEQQAPQAPAGFDSFDDDIPFMRLHYMA